MTTMQYRTKESSINYRSARTDGGNKSMEANKGLTLESDKCRICRQIKETVMHWLSECTWLAATEYLKGHNNALMILCVALGIQDGLLGK